ncbi:MAG: phosphoenolpyruvate--protein phosphotransferase [Treponema sp.]|jgi:phosphotransferase system enzyme I (PtsI)|nr:phosphoenolpyruvate--protein phosphotransferase [Treponema sp.]
MILKGNGAAGGLAVGKVFVYLNDNKVPVESFIIEDGEQREIDRYIYVKKQAFDFIEKIKYLMQNHDPQKAAIFSAQQEIIEDIVINEEIPAKISNDRWTGDWAIYHVYETVLTVLRQTGDPLISERAADFNDVRSLLLRIWNGNEGNHLGALSALKEPVIIAAGDLMPSDTASFDRNKVIAILCERGGSTSHTAIIAKSYGIPAVMGIHDLLDYVKPGQLAAVNADEGTVILEPDEGVILEYNKRIGEFYHEKQVSETFLTKEACTSDGIKIDIGLNISDASLDGAQYADFAGLFRTEFLYMGRSSLPCEEEQFSIYRSVLECFTPQPVILRTLDVGGDKKPECIEFPPEENPFLGNRALRFCFNNPEIFKTQVRAALRASVFGNLYLMLPMVESLESFRKAKKIIISVKEELAAEGISSGDVKIGIMVEIPSIAVTARLAAKEADFASIGSNDLCQYLCAADRMNSEMEPYYQSYHPAMFTLINETVSAFRKEGKPVSICGEIGADVHALPVLIGLGLRRFSMNASSVASVKRAIASLSMEKAAEITENVLQLATAGEIKQYLADNFARTSRQFYFNF